MPQVLEPGFMTERQRWELCGRCPEQPACFIRGLNDPDAEGTWGGVDVVVFKRRAKRLHSKHNL